LGKMGLTTLWTRNFVMVCFSNLLQFMIFYILVATLPLFVTQQLQGGEEATGLIMSAFLLSVVLFRPIAGKLIDAYDKRKVLLFSLVLFVVIALIYPFASNIFLLLVLRFLHGISFGISNTTTATMAVEAIPDHRKGEGVSYYSLFMTLGMAIGPFIGLTITTNSNFSVLFGFCIFLAVLSLLVGILVQPAKTVKKTTETNLARFSWQRFFEPDAMVISLAGCCVAFAWSGVATFFSVYAHENGLVSAARYFFVVYSGTILLSRPFVGRIFDRRGAGIIIYPACSLLVVGLLLLSQAHTTALFLAAAAVIGLGVGSLFSSYQTLAVQYSPLNKRGLGTSTFFCFYDIGMVLGSFLLGLVAAHIGYSSMYIISAAMMFLSAWLYKLAAKKNRPSEK